ncbi:MULTISPECIES: GNAT family N-acetyltransferase [unclassified Caballeronia]|uniref:GNAT family N-acetyltransferase n=1 Tax=unclassified Caballeronia TaxID=2646786 RepID=UPI00286152CD|nr:MULTISPECIES: GNAT family N-acetyltransferase [unclassified Caballeronia]MDR5754177.1 GNAT family N-acetyltransferase [Caballeronia sp. LZ024]MDR5840555.1 GNAT family N-acetyltransferase [Caballeronia sp. LZ031]
MNASAFTLRRLTPADSVAYRDIRLEGLRLHPDGFGASYDDEAIEPLAWFEARIADHAVFGGSLPDGTLAGIAGLLVPAHAKLRHKGMLWGMYVRPAARGTGLAAAIVARVLEHARDVVEEVQLVVAPDNEAAIRLYRAAGFEPFAREPRALKIDGVYHDSLLMTLPFGKTA